MDEHVTDGFVQHRLHLQKLGEVEIFVPAPSGTPSVLPPANLDPVIACYGAWRNPGTAPLVRVQSRCMYGEVLLSVDCDCREQLDLAMDRIKAEGAGVIVYLDQEGRNAGQLNKARGYRYSQEHSVDSFKAYDELGLQTDARDYTRAADLLRRLGLSHVRLMTNNPQKLASLEKGLDTVERLELWPVHPGEEASRYLHSKIRRGHLMPAERHGAGADRAWYQLATTPADGAAGEPGDDRLEIPEPSAGQPIR